MTYTTVIAVCYPELDSVQDGELAFGNYLFGTQSTHGGFLPVFWNAPTAYMQVLLAQTRVGFLSGGRGKCMRDLTPTEFLAQLEEAYARATVALTRAQRLFSQRYYSLQSDAGWCNATRPECFLTRHRLVLSLL